MDEYEKFIDKYVKFMKKYEKEGRPLSMLSEYTELMTQYTEFAEEEAALVRFHNFHYYLHLGSSCLRFAISYALSRYVLSSFRR